MALVGIALATALSTDGIGAAYAIAAVWLAGSALSFVATELAFKEYFLGVAAGIKPPNIFSVAAAHEAGLTHTETVHADLVFGALRAILANDFVHTAVVNALLAV